jgi:hypothetical protein
MTQLQIMWSLWTKDFAEMLETHLAEVKHQGELKHQHSEPLAGGEPLLCRPWDFGSSGLLLSPTRATLTQTPTPQTGGSLSDQAPKAYQACESQAFTISTRPEPLRPAKHRIHKPALSPPGHAPKASTSLHDLCFAWPRPLGMPGLWSTVTAWFPPGRHP